MPLHRALPLIALASIVLFIAAPADADPLPSTMRDGLLHWRWTGHAAAVPPIRLDLIRANVTIEPSAKDEIEIDLSLHARPEHAQRLWIDAAVREGALLIQDRYPARARWAMFGNECLPPADERGDFWLVPATLHVVIHAPRGERIDVDIREGNVTDNRR